MADRERIHVIYDGQCAFCIRSLRVARALDVRQALRFHDATDRVAVEARFPSLRGADLNAAMYAVTEGGQTYRGFFGFRRMAWSSPLTWPLLVLLYFPGAAWLGPKVYAWVARNRSNLGCRSPVCSVPPGDSEALATGSAEGLGPRGLVRASGAGSAGNTHAHDEIG